jgi:hypothetical protein
MLLLAKSPKIMQRKQKTEWTHRNNKASESIALSIMQTVNQQAGCVISVAVCIASVAVTPASGAQLDGHLVDATLGLVDTQQAVLLTAGYVRFRSPPL